MSAHKCVEHIPNYAPDDVFRVVTLVETVPEDPRFALKIDGGDRFTKGVPVSVQFPAGGRDRHINGKVTDYSPGERLAIKGASDIGKAALWLDLSPDEKRGGTEVAYGFSINSNLRHKIVEPAVMLFLKLTLPGYAGLYVKNTIKGLDDGLHKAAY